MADPPCIQRTFFGGQEEITYADFSEKVIQDDIVAKRIASRMLDGDTPYAYNEDDEPNVYEEFEIVSESALRAQLREFWEGGKDE